VRYRVLPSRRCNRVQTERGTVMSFLAELWAFMRARKKFWLVPVLIMMVIFGGLVAMTKGSIVAPFIYTIF
jgi:Family of unknown function (DUF5989)